MTIYEADIEFIYIDNNASSDTKSPPLLFETPPEINIKSTDIYLPLFCFPDGVDVLDTFAKASNQTLTHFYQSNAFPSTTASETTTESIQLRTTLQSINFHLRPSQKRNPNTWGDHPT